MSYNRPSQTVDTAVQCFCYYGNACCRYLHNDTATTTDNDAAASTIAITDNTTITAATSVEEDCRWGQHNDSSMTA